MEFKQVGGVECFDDMTLYWVNISDLPPEVQSKAREIDGEAYDPDSFEMCAIFDLNTRTFSYETDGGELNIYYVDTSGNRCWFQADFAENFLNEVYSACEKITDGKTTPHGYEVKDSMLFDDQNGFVLAENPKASNPFAVWRFSLDKHGRRNYTQGHFFENRAAAERDFFPRCKEYQRFNGVNEVKPSLAERLQAAKQEAARQTAPSHNPPDRDAR